MLTYSLSRHGADTQPCKDCSCCMELLPYCKGVVVPGELPEMELHPSLSPPDRDTVPFEHTVAFADTAPFVIYGKLPQHPPWMPSFPLCRHVGARNSASAIPSHSRFGDKDGYRHISPAVSSFSVGADAAGSTLHCCVEKQKLLCKVLMWLPSQQQINFCKGC